MKILAVEAVGEAIGRVGVITLRRTTGPEPFDSRPQMTYGDIWAYWDELLQQLIPLLHSQTVELAQKTAAVLPAVLSDYTIQAPPEHGVPLLEDLVPRVLDGTVPVAISDLIDALQQARNGLRADQERHRDHIATLDRLITTIEGGQYSTRLKRWVGSWEYGEQETDEDGRTVFHGDLMIRRLATEASENPIVLTAEVLQWLTSNQAKRSPDFFYWLGRFDTYRTWLPSVEGLGELQSGERAFSCYMGGRSASDAAFVNGRLDDLTTEGRVLGEAIVGATHYLPADQSGVRRIRQLVEGGRVEAVRTERILAGGGWMEPLTTEGGYELLRTIAGGDHRHAAAVIDFLAMWLHHGKPLEGALEELAWRCFESAPEVKRQDAYDFEVVAGALASGNPERALGLLATLIRQRYDSQTWNPLDHVGRSQYWEAMERTDCRRLLALLLELSQENQLQRHRISWHLSEWLDLERNADSLSELALASEGNAEVVLSWIRPSQTGFWPIVFVVFEGHAESRRVHNAIVSAAHDWGHVILGPISEHTEARAASIENVIADPSTPIAIRRLLEQIATNLRKEAEQERHDESDREVNL